MITTLICEERLYSVFLPEKVRGQFWIEDDEKDITDDTRRMISIEADGGRWQIRANKALKLYREGNGEPQKSITLEEGRLYMAVLGREQLMRGYLFAEAYTRDRCTFRKYRVINDAALTIGKSPHNAIQVSNPHISNTHARLIIQSGMWSVYDNNSSNGVYVNNVRLRGSARLKPGDVISIMGFKIVVGNQFFAINNPDHSVSIRSAQVAEYTKREAGAYEAPDERKSRIYYRSPRFKREIEPLKLTIDGPTTQETHRNTPLALALGPSLVMGCASFATGLVTTVNTVRNQGSVAQALPSMIMCISMLVGMIVFPFIMKMRDRRMAAENEMLRREMYLKYLGNIRAEIYKASALQREILNENYPFIMTQLSSQEFYERTLWNRVIGEPDFLTFRIGMGNVPLLAELRFPEQRFSIDDDIMRDEVNRFSEEKKVLEGVPVTFSLLENRVAGIIGDRVAVEEMMNNILLQIAALHSYDEVKIIFLCEEKDLHKYEYVKWMQHCWNNENDYRYLAANPEELRELSAYFSRIINERRAEKGTVYPHYLIISASKALSDRCALVSQVTGDSQIAGFSFLAVYDELKNLPKECSLVIQMHRDQAMMYNRGTTSGEKLVFVPDHVPGVGAERSVMDIADFTLDLWQGKYALPGMLSFMDMLGVGKIEHLNIATRWKENNPAVSLQTPVGVDSDGGTFYLDLHEKAHGPHGLVAGMTGSGKSEFIITYILSLALNYHPDEVAFILIDYKGGGLTGAFENAQYRLPHLAGTITNLDGNAIARSLLSIQSELRRRQAIFNAAREVSNEGTMDIYKYQKLYRSGVVGEAVPHLFIISDEFAELKSQQPEFMEQLISAARIGRSLGVHLILATQKPGGVVNEQIWANSRFKVCLKVQDRTDSMDMLKRPDAAELVETGRFYLQVGYNELFELGQSAWCGAPYVPREQVEKEVDESVQLLNHLGSVVEEAKPQRDRKETAGSRQIVEVMKYIAQIAAEEGARAKALWLPEIPFVITVDDTRQKYRYQMQSEFELTAVLGEYDDPYNQRQDILTLSVSEGGNTVVYGSVGTGKTTFLTALLYSLYQDYTSETLNVFILDFGAETLRMFEQAPQTADFIIAGEDEKVNNLFSWLKREINRRKKLFTDYGGDYNSYCRSSFGRAGGAYFANAPEKLPNILILLNNYPNFVEQYETLDDSVTVLTRECSKYGIYFVITSPSQMGIRFKLQQNLPQVFVLQLNDESDYSAILGRMGGVFPARTLGRGVFRRKDVYVYQTAQATGDVEHRTEFIRDFCARLGGQGNQRKAKPVPTVPQILYQSAYADFPVTFQNIPIGLETDSLENYVLDMRKYGVLQVLAMAQEDTAAFVGGMAKLLHAGAGIETWLFDAGKKLALEGWDAGHLITENFEEPIAKLFEITVERYNAYKLSGGRVEPETEMHPIIVIINGLSLLKSGLSGDGASKLKLMMERTHGRLNLSFVAVDDYQASGHYSGEAWCGGSGIWVGSGILEQFRYKFNHRNLSADMAADCTSGYVVEKNQVHLVKLIVSDGTEREGGDG